MQVLVSADPTRNLKDDLKQAAAAACLTSSLRLLFGSALTRI